MVEIRDVPVPLRYSHAFTDTPDIRGRWECDQYFWEEFHALGTLRLWVELSNGQTIIVRAKK